MVNTAKVAGRRLLKFDTLDDILADVERLAQDKVRAIGNWSPGQNLTHLAIIMNGCMGGIPYKAPFYLRAVAWFLKNNFVKNPMPAGFDLPKAAAALLVPGETSWEDGVQTIRVAIARMKTEPQRHPHPVLGALTRAQWDQLHCRHCELHLSFLIPEG
jgi:hypothetical protein